jgi:hypothetical protein
MWWFPGIANHVGCFAWDEFDHSAQKGLTNPASTCSPALIEQFHNQTLTLSTLAGLTLANLCGILPAAH